MPAASAALALPVERESERERKKKKRGIQGQTGVARRTYLGTDAPAPDVVGRSDARESVLVI